MRNGLALLAAGALFLSPILAESLLGQQQGGGQGVQGVVGGVSTPDAAQGGGRQGGGGAGERLPKKRASGCRHSASRRPRLM
jgi:hypothetical protein